MKRAVLLPTPGDPFVLAYWLRNYERVWKDWADELSILVNGQTDSKALAWIRNECSRLNAKMAYEPRRVGHGEAIRALLEASDADVVMLAEDDAYVRNGEYVDITFESIELGYWDVIGTPRGGMDPEIETFARAKWVGHNMTAPEPHDPPSNGPGLWPCFLFARREQLLATSRIFGPKSWYPGETIPGLDYLVLEREMTTDCFTTTAFELRGAGLRIQPTVQYKELWQKDMPNDRLVPWFHAGGLSNGGWWDAMHARPDIGGTYEGLDWAHRIWWWRRCASSATRSFATLQAADYIAALERLTMRLGVAGEVWDWGARLEPWINWDDQE